MARKGGCLYETISAPFSAFPADETSSFAGDSYTVLRNEITSPTDAAAAAAIPVVDYFSLDASPAESPLRDGDETPLRFVSGRVTESVSRPCPSERAWFRSGSRFKSPMLQLHKEILDFSEFVSPTPEEQASRTAAVESVFEVIKYIWPHCKVEVFGSFRTGIYLPTSDIDVVILESNVTTPQTGLYALSRALSQRGIAKKVQVIAKARVPIVKFVEKQSGIAFDISFDMESGPIAAEFIKDALRKIPPLRPLCLILKVFLQQRELNEVYSGGVGSYALIVMLIAYLQIHLSRQHFQSGEQPVELNLGILLVSFFDFYGRKLNTTDIGVSCNLAGTFFLKSDKGFLNTVRPHLLSIEDPLAPDNDIGRNSFSYFKVRSAFSMAYSSLTDAKAIARLGQKRSILGTIIRPDAVLLDRKGGVNGELTFDTLLPGAGEPVLQQFGEDKDMIYISRLLLDDEPLPRENVIVEDENLFSSQRSISKVKRRSTKSGKHERWVRRDRTIKPKTMKNISIGRRIGRSSPSLPESQADRF